MKLFGNNFNKYRNITGIYCISYKDKKYIGSAIDLRSRIRRHRRELCDNEHHNILLQRFFNKYGSLNWNVEILHTFKYKIKEDQINLLRVIEFHFIKDYSPFFNIKLCEKDSLYNSEKKKSSYNAIVVHKYDKKGNYLDTYPSAMEAAKQNKCSHSGISACVRKQQGVYSCGGFRWSKNKYKKLPKREKQYSFEKRPIIAYKKNFTKRFDSITEASIFICGDNSLLQRIRYAALKDKTVKNYKFRFV